VEKAKSLAKELGDLIAASEATGNAIKAAKPLDENARHILVGLLLLLLCGA
jgi:hypothetical protein